MFKKATKTQAFLRMALHGPSGSGKTYSALRIGTALASLRGGRVALLDTEAGSASKYADQFDFDVVELVGDYHPERIGKIIQAAQEGGYSVVVVDSMTHFWNGPGGFLELVDREVAAQKARGKAGDSFGAWKIVDPIYRRMIQSIITSKLDIIVTTRAKTEYAKGTGKSGNNQIEKLGLQPEMRDGFQYEFDIEGMLGMDHDLVIGKTRCASLDRAIIHEPGREIAQTLHEWLTAGAAPSADQMAEDVAEAASLANLLANELGFDLPDNVVVAALLPAERSGPKMAATLAALRAPSDRTRQWASERLARQQ